MRWNAFLIACLVASVALSGCTKGSDDTDKIDTHDDPCAMDQSAHDALEPGASDGDDTDAGALDDVNATLARLAASQTDSENTTDDAMDHDGMDDDACDDDPAPTPNVPPVAALAMTSDDGILQDGTTYVLAGDNVTFSAAGSSDDGSIQLAALTITDSNSTRTVQLYVDGFQDAILNLPHEGPVNVTLRVLDNEGAVDVLEAMLYVNRVQSVSVPVDLPLPAGHNADACDYPDLAQPLVWQRFMDHAKFGVASGARWISTTMTGGDGEYAVCSPDGTALTSAGAGPMETVRGGDPLAPSPLYSVFAIATGGIDTMTFDVMVHYEP